MKNKDIDINAERLVKVIEEVNEEFTRKLAKEEFEAGELGANDLFKTYEDYIKFYNRKPIE